MPSGTFPTVVRTSLPPAGDCSMPSSMPAGGEVVELDQRLGRCGRSRAEVDLPDGDVARDHASPSPSRGGCWCPTRGQFGSCAARGHLAELRARVHRVGGGDAVLRVPEAHGAAGGVGEEVAVAKARSVPSSCAGGIVVGEPAEPTGSCELPQRQIEVAAGSDVPDRVRLRRQRPPWTRLRLRRRSCLPGGAVVGRAVRRGLRARVGSSASAPTGGSAARRAPPKSRRWRIRRCRCRPCPGRPGRTRCLRRTPSRDRPCTGRSTERGGGAGPFEWRTRRVASSGKRAATLPPGSARDRAVRPPRTSRTETPTEETSSRSGAALSKPRDG